jgi:predicted phosphodiesterase
MVTESNLLKLPQQSEQLLVFGGPYSNLQATVAVKARAEQLGILPGRVICTGDTIAYCGEPEATVNQIREWGCHVVMGNCEDSLGNDLSDCGCGFEEGSVCAELSIDWYNHALRAVSLDNKKWMKSLPTRIDFTLCDTTFAVIHGSMSNFSEFVFGSGDEKIKSDNLEHMGVDCVIGGHCGLPFGQQLSKGHWLNAGVIGMPANDGTHSTWYLLLSPLGGSIRASWHRLDFDYRTTMKNMEESGLPRDYIDALETGHWPSMSVLPAHEMSIQAIPLEEHQLII